MVQSGYRPRVFPENQSEISLQLALSYVWTFMAWLQIAGETTSDVKPGVVAMAIPFVLNAILHIIMYVLSRHRRQNPISKEPLLVSQQNSSKSSSIHYEKLAENILLAVGWIATGFLLTCLYNELERGISLIRTCCLLLGMFSSSIHLYAYRSLNSGRLQLAETSFTFLMQCYQVQYLSALSSNDTHFVVQRSIYVVLSLVFVMLVVTRTFEKKRTVLPAKFLFEFTRNCSSKFTIGVEDDTILLQEIPMPPMPSG